MSYSVNMKVADFKTLQRVFFVSGGGISGISSIPLNYFDLTVKLSNFGKTFPQLSLNLRP